MQVERQHPVGAGAGDQIGDELGGNRRARSEFAILPGIAVIGDDGRDPPRRRTPQRVDDDQQLHQVVIGRIGGRLDHENVGAADVFLDLDENLHVGEAPHHRFGERRTDIGANALGQRRIGITGNELDGSVIARHFALLESASGRLPSWTIPQMEDYGRDHVQKHRPDTGRLGGWQPESGPCPRRIFCSLPRFGCHRDDKRMVPKASAESRQRLGHFFSIATHSKLQRHCEAVRSE